MLVGLDLQFQFRSTLPHGERLASSQNSTPLLLFRSTLPHGERRDVPSGVRICSEFRSTLPHGERRGWNGLVRTCPSFDPRSRTGSDASSRWHGIRAYVFRSTLPHGERLRYASWAASAVSFRSTLPHGERRHVPQPVADRVGVSIHAPARGATIDMACSRLMPWFRSTLPHGERRPGE